jgi:histidinol-phosphate aminotransferase
MTRPPLRRDLSELPRYVAGRPPRAGGFKLSSNELAEPPDPSVLAAASAVLSHLNRYPDLGAGALTERLAALLEMPADRVVAGGGSIAVLQQLLLATVDPGRAVVFPWRSYEAYPIVVRVAHADPVPVPLSGARHDVAAMATAVHDHHAAMVIVCSPNNPTGTAIRRPELERFLDEVPSSTVVVLDEAYREFVTDPEVADGVALARDRSNVVVLRTFSKAHGLASARVGYVVAPPAIADALRAVALPFTVSALGEAAAIAALDAWPRQRVVVAEVSARRDLAVAALRAEGIAVPDSQANFVWLPEDQVEAQLAEALADAGVSVRAFPGDGIRMSIGEPEAIALALQVVAGTRRVTT